MAIAEATIELDAEYRLLREEAGVVAATGLTAVALTGPDATDYLQGQVTNDVLALGDGEGCYAALLSRKGQMRADLRVLRVGDSELLLLTEEIAREALVGHLDTYRIGREVQVADRRVELAVLSVIGPAALARLNSPGGAELSHGELTLAGCVCRAVATDRGVDVVCPAEAREAVLAALAAARIPLVRPEAAEILRVEAGRPRFGAEMDERTIPQEAGINDRAISFTKGCYIGQETVARLHYKGKPNRHLRGLRLDSPAAAGDPLQLGDRDVGRIGTACISPALGPIALALVRREAGPGSELTVGDTGRATVAELPLRDG